MNRLELEDVLKTIIESISKSKRFSELSYLELCDLWKGLSKYISEQLILKRSVNVSGIGAFHIKKGKKVTSDQSVYTSYFVPSTTWDKIPGYQIDRSFLQEVHGGCAEPLNLASVAANTGFPREMVESGIKDIVNALIRILRDGNTAILTMGNVGKLLFQNNDVKFKFSAKFLNSLVESKPKPEPVVISKPATAINQEVVEKNESVIENKEKDEKIVVLEEKQVEKVALNTNNEAMTQEALKELKEATDRLQNLEQLIDSTFSPDARNTNTHTHQHTGNRKWSDQKCPICRQHKAEFVDERDILKKIEKEQDRMYLHLSLQVDNEYIEKKKEYEKSKWQAAAETAQFNRSTTLEHASHNCKESLPMGNIFEKRKLNSDPRAAFLLAEKLREQAEKEKSLTSSEEKLISETLKTELILFNYRIKAAELKAHYDRIQKCKMQRDALAEQIRLRKDSKEFGDEIPSENPHARSESLMALYQREKAKQLYQEQLAIVRQRQAYASKVQDLEKRHSLERLALSRKELEKDIKSIRKGKLEARKSLESYWKEQISLKEKLKLDVQS